MRRGRGRARATISSTSPSTSRRVAQISPTRTGVSRDAATFASHGTGAACTLTKRGASLPITFPPPLRDQRWPRVGASLALLAALCWQMGAVLRQAFLQPAPDRTTNASVVQGDRDAPTATAPHSTLKA